MYWYYTNLFVNTSNEEDPYADACKKMSQMRKAVFD